jgi:EmrB/QacA subfamily drug resistance transporter
MEATLGTGSGRSPAVILGVACVAQLMVSLDSTIVTVALPSMRTDLSLSAGAMQWVVNGYTLSLAGLLLLGGRMADVFGRKRVFLAGLALFTLASVAGGLAGTGPLLIAARVAQGAGAAILSPATLSLITNAYPDPNRRRRALGVWTAAASSGGALGAVSGGLLTQLLSWHWVLLVNVPVGVALFAAAAVAVGRTPGTSRGVRQLDLPGTLAVSLGLVALVYGVVVTDTSPWGSPRNLIALGIGIALLAVFVAIEARSKHPLLPLGLLRLRAVACANGLALLLGGGMSAMFYFLSLYLQNVVGLSPLVAGLAFVPSSLAMVAGSMTGTRLLPVLGARRLLILDGVFAFGGVLWLSRLPLGGTLAHDVLAQVVIASFGVGMGFVPITIASFRGVGTEKVGVATGLMKTSQQVGSVIGLAALASAAARRSTELLHAHGTSQIAGATGGYQLALLLASGLLLAAVAVSLAMPQLTPEPALLPNLVNGEIAR